MRREGQQNGFEELHACKEADPVVYLRLDHHHVSRVLLYSFSPGACTLSPQSWERQRPRATHITQHLANNLYRAIAAVGAAFNAPGPYKRPFSLVDLSISYPFTGSQISTTLLVILSLVVPAVLIFLVCLLFVPGPTVSPNTPKSLIWRRKFWEWNSEL